LGGEPLPDGTVVKIYWDANSNGPDALDQQPPVGGGFGQCTFNEFLLNGEALLGMPGTFYMEEYFTFASNTPSPSRYYLVAEAGVVRWTSVVMTFADGFSQQYVLETPSEWSCEITQVPCTLPNHIEIATPGGRNFLPEGTVYNQCLEFCANQLTTICLGPLSWDETPVAHFTPGCLPVPPISLCDVVCPPALLEVDPAGWTYNTATSSWCIVVRASNDGCACFTLERILSAETGTFAAVARDNSVELTWTTQSESNVASFDVLRKVSGHASYDKVGNMEAANTTSGSTYTFVDAGAVNGTTYEYTLETVNMDGSHEAWGMVVTATPSSDAAVITEYALHQNYPNPFNPSTSLVFDVVNENVVNLTVYNAMGQEVASLVNGTMGAGRHTVSFDASNLTSGLYFYTVKIGNEFTATKKMLLVK
jgi:hypothetical protein